jgi:hypothetical protein
LPPAVPHEDLIDVIRVIWNEGHFRLRTSSGRRKKRRNFLHRQIKELATANSMLTEHILSFMFDATLGNPNEIIKSPKLIFLSFHCNCGSKEINWFQCAEANVVISSWILLNHDRTNRIKNDKLRTLSNKYLDIGEWCLDKSISLFNQIKNKDSTKISEAAKQIKDKLD